MLNYEKKYLKYKIKYLELKKQIGGVFGVGDCSFIKHNQENARQAYKCYYNNDNFVITDIKKFEIKDLRVAGIDKDKTAIPNFTNDVLRSGGNIGFSAKQLKAAGFSAKDFKNGNDAINLAYPIDAHNIRFSADDLKEIFSLEELKKAGFSVKELIKYRESSTYMFTGFSAEELKTAGFSVTELKEGGVKITNLFENKNEKELKKLGFKELKELGFNAKEFIELLIYFNSYIRPKPFKNYEGCDEKQREKGCKEKLIEIGFTPTEIEDAFKK